MKNKWEDWVINGGEFPTLVLPDVPYPEGYDPETDSIVYGTL